VTQRVGGAVLWVAIVLAPGTMAGDTALQVYDAMGLKVADVLSGSVLQAKILPGADKQVVAAVTYLTGKRDEAEAVNVRLEVYRRDGDRLSSIYARDYGAESEGPVGRGEIQVIDLNGDGRAEIMMTWDDLSSKVIEDRRGELIVHDGGQFEAVWSGPVSYDATKAPREIPEERRDRFVREIDVPATLKTRGITLILKKTVYAVAGQRLPEPKTVQETFPFEPGSAQ